MNIMRLTKGWKGGPAYAIGIVVSASRFAPSVYSRAGATAFKRDLSPDDDAATCDICQGELPEETDFVLNGKGIWLERGIHGTQVVERNVCASCSVGIGVFQFNQAMSREDEG